MAQQKKKSRKPPSSASSSPSSILSSTSSSLRIDRLDPESLSTILGQRVSSAKKKEKTRRRFSLSALPAVFLLLLASGAGIALATLTTLYPFLRAGQDLPSRILVFSASVMGFSCATAHLVGARTDYFRPKGSGPPQIYGNHLHAAALMLGRFGLPVWIVAIVLTSLLIAKIGVVLNGGLEGKSPYISILVCAVGLWVPLSPPKPPSLHSPRLLFFCAPIT